MLGCLLSVLEGRADAVISNYASINYLISKHAVSGLRLAFFPKDSELISLVSITVRKDWSILRDILQKSMNGLDHTQVDALRKEWLGTDQQIVAVEPNRKLQNALIAALVLLSLLLIFQGFLRSESATEIWVALMKHDWPFLLGAAVVV